MSAVEDRLSRIEECLKKILSNHRLEPADDFMPAARKIKPMQSFEYEEGLTVIELKALIKDWPELGYDGEPCEVWVCDADGISNIVIAAEVLNYRKADGARRQVADIMLRHGARQTRKC